MQKTAGALSELAQPEIQGKLGNDGLSVVANLRSYQDTLSGFDSVRLINRIDYSDTLAAADDALAKVQQFKNEIGQVAHLATDVQELNNRIDRRGRQLLEGPTSSKVADITKSVSTLSSAKIPLSSEDRLQLSNTQVALNHLSDEMDREEREQELKRREREFEARWAEEARQRSEREQELTRQQPATTPKPSVNDAGPGGDMATAVAKRLAKADNIDIMLKGMVSVLMYDAVCKPEAGLIDLDTYRLMTKVTENAPEAKLKAAGASVKAEFEKDPRAACARLEKTIKSKINELNGMAARIFRSNQ